MTEHIGVTCPQCGQLAVYITLNRVWEGDPSIPRGRHYFWDPGEIEVACGCILDDDEFDYVADRALLEAPYPG